MYELGYVRNVGLHSPTFSPGSPENLRSPLATQSTPAGVTTSAPASTTAASSKKPSSTGSAAASATASKAAALSVRAGWAGAALGALVGVTMF